MPNEPITQKKLYWLATFEVEFSNTNILHHEKRVSTADHIEVKEEGTEGEIITKLLAKFDKIKIEKSIEPNKNYCFVKKIKLEAFETDSLTNSKPAPRTHFQLNRAVESFYGLKQWSLLRS